MQPYTDFDLDFELPDFHPSDECYFHLQAFMDASIESYSGAYPPPLIFFNGCHGFEELLDLRDDYKSPIEKAGESREYI